MTGCQTLPELAEADAPADIAKIYQALRRLSGAPMVALIWRHLATYPDVLPKAWSALEPLFRAGAIQEAAWRSAAHGVVAPAAQVTRARLAAAGLDTADQEAFVRVLDAYNRANPVNFVGVRLLLRAIRGEVGGQSVDMRAWTPPPAISGLARMASIGEFLPDHRRMIDALSSSDQVDRSRVVPSLYRHLTGWPALIPLIHADLEGRFQSGEIARAVGAVALAMDREVQSLSAFMPTLDALQAHDGVTETLERFSSLIPEMVTVGLLLRRGIDGEG
ncbi:MAG: halocarboxylic acid dehydrogenase DehI family protein [Hyphomicrobiaceae bacterium]